MVNLTVAITILNYYLRNRLCLFSQCSIFEVILLWFYFLILTHPMIYILNYDYEQDLWFSENFPEETERYRLTGAAWIIIKLYIYIYLVLGRMPLWMNSGGCITTYKILLKEVRLGALWLGFWKDVKSVLRVLRLF